jgi:Ca-activated chloride channel homolog
MKYRLLSLLGLILLPALTSAHRAPSGIASPEATVQVRVETDRTVLPAERLEKATVKVALDGLRLPRPSDRAPVNLALVIDRSGSMTGDKMAKAREAALEAVRRFAPDDLVALVVYDNEAETLVPAQRVGDGRHLENAIRGITPRGATALYDGVMRGVSEIRRHFEDRRFINRVILLSDGLANVGPSTPDELGRLGASLLREGISVTTIGLGLGFNEDLMTRLAQRSDGNTYFVERSQDLPHIFAAELGDVLNVVARRVVVTVEFDDGIRPLGFVGREGTIRQQRAEFTLNQLYGGQERFALIEVEVASHAAGTEREIARVAADYENPLTRRAVQATAAGRITFSRDAAAVVASANHQVQADWASNIIAQAKDEAIALVDAKRPEAAARTLEQRSRELEAIGHLYSNPTVRAMAVANTEEADRIQAEGLSNARRKEYRAASAQTRSQQTSTSAPPATR